MSIVGACMVPHPPIILPEVGRGEEKKIAATYRAYERAAEFVAETKPETIIVTSPHVILYSDWFHISPGKRASGDMRRFGAPGTKLQVTYDTELRDVICRNAHAMDFPAGTLGEREAQLDHATFIPLWFINQKYTDYKLIRIGLSGFSLSEHYRLGQLIQKSIDETGRRVFFVGSGDLSHKLLAEGPYGLDENGPVYDERIMRDMGAADFGALLDYPPEFLDRAAECGHRSFCIMAGALDGLRVRPEMLSHEGTFGVGYGIVLYHMEDSADDAGSIGSAATGSGNAGVSAGKQGISGGCDLARKFLDRWFEKKNAELAKARAAEDPWVRLARATVERYVRDHHVLTQAEALQAVPEINADPAASSAMLGQQAGTFVSIHKEGQLRGCIGTIAATKKNILQEIIGNGVSAATRDPRFTPIRPEELPLLEITVDVLGDAEEISGPEELDVKRYGVIVEKGGRRGLLLPNLDGVDTVADQIRIAKQKAGIPEHERRVRLQRFEVVRHY